MQHGTAIRSSFVFSVRHVFQTTRCIEFYFPPLAPFVAFVRYEIAVCVAWGSHNSADKDLSTLAQLTRRHVPKDLNSQIAIYSDIHWYMHHVIRLESCLDRIIKYCWAHFRKFPPTSPPCWYHSCVLFGVSQVQICVRKSGIRTEDFMWPSAIPSWYLKLD